MTVTWIICSLENRHSLPNTSIRSPSLFWAGKAVLWCPAIVLPVVCYFYQPPLSNMSNRWAPTSRALHEREIRRNRKLHHQRLRKIKPSIDMKPPRSMSIKRSAKKREQIQADRQSDINYNNALLMDKILHVARRKNKWVSFVFLKRKWQNFLLCFPGSKRERRKQKKRRKKGNERARERVDAGAT